MGWGQRNKTHMQRQANSREAIQAAVAYWASMTAAVEQEQTHVITTPNRDGRPLLIEVTIRTVGLDSSAPG